MRRLRTALWALAVICGIVYLVTSFQIVTDISAFLPDDSSKEQRVMREVATGKLARQMVLTIEVPQGHSPASISRAFEEELRRNTAWLSLIAHLDGGLPTDHQEALWTLYHERWPYFFAENAEEASQKLSEQGLAQAAQTLREELRGPMSMLTARMAPSDPFLVTRRVFDRLENAQAGTITADDGRYITEDRRYAVLFLSTHASAFENAVQQDVLQGIHRAFQRLNERYDNALVLEMSGVNRISIAAQKTIERDIQRISILSAILLFALLWTIFGGIRVAFLAMTSMGTGVVMALCASHLLFGRVHGIALAFGASLIGLAIDYVLHLYSHYADAQGKRSATEVIRQILPALLIAATSTLTGFVALAFTGFPGLREVAVFAVVGLGSALLCVATVLVDWLPKTIPETRLRTLLAHRLVQLVQALRTNKVIVAVVFVTLATVIALGLPKIRWSGQWGESSQFDRALVQEEERVRARVSQFDQSRLIVSTGESVEAALQSAEQVAERLAETEVVGGFASIAHLLPSEKKQRAVAQVVQQSPEQTEARFAAVFGDAGFRAQMFEPFYQTLNNPLPPPLDLRLLTQSSLASVARAWIDETQSDAVILTPLRDVKDTAALRALIDDIPGATYIDERDMMGDAQGDQRQRILLAVTLGFLVVCALLYARYRRLRIVLSALVPPLLSVAFTWSVLALFGIHLDLIVVAFSLLIISLGVDYGVFLIDTLHVRGPDLRAALVGIFMVAATTLIGFGLLAASDFPILHRVGLVALIGVSSAVVLSPIALVLAGEEKVS